MLRRYCCALGPATCYVVPDCSSRVFLELPPDAVKALRTSLPTSPGRYEGREATSALEAASKHLQKVLRSGLSDVDTVALRRLALGVWEEAERGVEHALREPDTANGRPIALDHVAFERNAISVRLLIEQSFRHKRDGFRAPTKENLQNLCDTTYDFFSCSDSNHSKSLAS